MITTTTRYHSIKRRKITMTVVYHVLVAAASLAMLYPLFWMLSSSFKPNNEIFTTVGNLIPQTFTTENYVNGWRGFAGLSFGVYFRNSIIVAGLSTIGAALSSALVVVEAQEKSGTMSTVNHAERYGKPVFVVPGSIYSPNSAGTNALLREGRAKAVCKPGDLFGVLGLRCAAAPAAVRSAPDPMSETERRVLACIGPKAKGVEELGAASGLPTGLLLGTLMKLELAGRVTCLPGKRYILR